MIWGTEVCRATGRAALALVLAALMVGAGAAATASAAPADMAQGFGDEGGVKIEGPRGETFAGDSSARMAIGPDGEIFVLTSDYECEWQWECPTQLTLDRFDAAGRRDPSFDVQLTVQEGPERQPFDVAVGPDGKPVVAAYDLGGPAGGGLRVFRFEPSGQADPGFGGAGEATQPLRPGHSAAVAAAVQPDGKVIVSTEGTKVEGGQELRVARYLPDGSPDPGFGVNGVASLSLPTQTRPADVLVSAAGSVTIGSPYCCVGGSALFGEGFSVARLLGNGQPDPGFAGSGQMRFATPGAEGLVESIALAPDGGTLVLFEERTETITTVDNLVKLAPDGSLDAGFGAAGRLRTYYRVGSMMPRAITVDEQGRIVGAGSDESKLAAFRLLANGSVDRTFNGGQRLRTRYSGRAIEVGLQASGRVVVLAETGCCSRRGFELVALRGGNGTVRCQGQGHPATIVGTARADELVGTKHRDVIAALGGADKVRGLQGGDVICGGPGRDTIIGGPGNDKIRE